ncbi:PD-(D/E)XK nuclease family transposase [Brachyspira murdochii]|uniref:Uncharacterized protein n=1 Tax=Brachyspira murdochii (strain ATCC 51284 / DSM 12563 / 56-150) TaxID=526224 RepID=D5U6U4_BRAM5|nr:PD-(D/E)XK nuclease family transposase [Brachyspira murdochii]ADG70660.1 hypothetical protein Bmur_0559 [Brachyspira murdochii DSM 12563]
MKDLEKLKYILNEPITVNNLNRINDYFIRYLFSHSRNENIVLNFINELTGWYKRNRRTIISIKRQ